MFKKCIWGAFVAASFVQAAECRFDFIELPAKLSETCYFQDIGRKKLNPLLRTYAPQFPLWTDGSEKLRMIYLPPGQKIDSSDAENWKYPVGTVFTKEFFKKGRRLEVRFLKKVRQESENNWIYGTYVWDEKEKDATLGSWARSNVRGTGHDIPSRQQCMGCHGVEKYVPNPKPTPQEPNLKLQDQRPLGFNALDLAGPELPSVTCRALWKNHSLASGPKLTLATLVQEDLLSHTHEWKTRLPRIAGNLKQQAGLGYLRGNCSSCHATEVGEGWLAPEFWLRGMDFRTPLHAADVKESFVYQTAVGQPTAYYRALENRHQAQVLRIKAGQASESVIFQRMSVRQPGEQMPASGTRQLDPYGLCVVEELIKSL